MESIKQILPSVIETMGNRKQPTVDFDRLWQAVAGPLAAYSKIKDFKNGVLKVHVDSPARLFQVGIKKQDLKVALKEKIPELKDIVLKVEKVSSMR